jgi:hydrogenase nickel incorporation protein HypA/HybF
MNFSNCTGLTWFKCLPLSNARVIYAILSPIPPSFSEQSLKCYNQISLTAFFHKWVFRSVILMHELTISQSILDIVLEKAHQARAKKVTEIQLVFGELSGFVPNAVRVCLEALRRDTIAAEATVTVLIVKAKAYCPECGHTAEVTQEDWLCPCCQKGGLKVIEGRELRVESIDIE